MNCSLNSRKASCILYGIIQGSFIGGSRRVQLVPNTFECLCTTYRHVGQPWMVPKVSLIQAIHSYECS